MGNYAVAADVKARFADVAEGAFVTDNEGAGVWDDTKVDAAIVLSEGQINSKIGQRFKTPVPASELAANTEAASFLKYMTVELAEVHLLRRTPPISEEKQRQYDGTLAMLDEIKEGKATIPGLTTLSSTASRDPLASWSDSTRTERDDSGRLFTRQTTANI